MSGPAKLWNRSFALLWQGQLVSSLGKNAFQLAALLWLKETTGSGTLSGLVGGAATLPMVLLGPIAGVFVDRVNRGRLIAWTDVAGGVLVSTAAVLFFAVPGSTPLLLAAVLTVTLGTGLLDTFSQPSIGASTPDLVPAEKLEAANGLHLSVLHAAMLVAQAASQARAPDSGPGVQQQLPALGPESQHRWQQLRRDELGRGSQYRVPLGPLPVTHPVASDSVTRLG